MMFLSGGTAYCYILMLSARRGEAAMHNFSILLSVQGEHQDFFLFYFFFTENTSLRADEQFQLPLKRFTTSVF